MDIRELAIKELNLNVDFYKECVPNWEHAGKEWEFVRSTTTRGEGPRDPETRERSEATLTRVDWCIPGTDIRDFTSGHKPDPFPTFEEWFERQLQPNSGNFHLLCNQVKEAGGVEEYLVAKEAKAKAAAEAAALCELWEAQPLKLEGYEVTLRGRYKLQIQLRGLVSGASYWTKDWELSEWEVAFEEVKLYIAETPQRDREKLERYHRDIAEHRAREAERKAAEFEANRTEWEPLVPACERLATALEKRGYTVTREGNPRKWWVKKPGTIGDELVSRAKKEKLLIPKSLL